MSMNTMSWKTSNPWKKVWNWLEINQAHDIMRDKISKWIESKSLTIISDKLKDFFWSDYISWFVFPNDNEKTKGFIIWSWTFSNKEKEKVWYFKIKENVKKEDWKKFFTFEISKKLVNWEYESKNFNIRSEKKDDWSWMYTICEYDKVNGKNINKWALHFKPNTWLESTWEETAFDEMWFDEAWLDSEINWKEEKIENAWTKVETIKEVEKVEEVKEDSNKSWKLLNEDDFEDIPF